jgi:hypothetical protein
MAPTRLHRWLKRGAIGVAALLGAIQLVPYGWNHSNPPVTQNAPWPSAEAESIARQSCYDCHSNESEWPPYSYVAPMSWLVRRDVEEGRDALNFSTWDQGEQEPHDAAEAVDEGSMPPKQYTFLHRDAKLSDSEKQVLIDALEAMDDGGGDNSGRGGGDDD